MVTTYSGRMNIERPNKGSFDWDVPYYEMADRIDIHYPRKFLPPPTLLTLVAGSAGGTLTLGTYYFYKITAINALGESIGSYEGKYPLPGTITNRFQATATGKIDMTWQPVTGVTGYYIYRADTTGVGTIPLYSAYKRTVVLGNVTTYTDTGDSYLNPPTYYFLPGGSAGEDPTSLTCLVTETDQLNIMRETGEASTYDTLSASSTLINNLNRIRYQLKTISGETTWDTALSGLSLKELFVSGKTVSGSGVSIYGGHGTAVGDTLTIYGSKINNRQIILNPIGGGVAINKPSATYSLDVGSGDLEVTNGNIRTNGMIRMGNSGILQNTTWKGDTIAIAYGGTNNTSFTSGQLNFYDTSAGKITGDSLLFWNNTNKHLGVGTSTPDFLGNMAGTTLGIFKTTSGVPYLSLGTDLTATTTVLGIINFGTSGAFTNKEAASILVRLNGSGVTNASGDMEFYTRNGASIVKRMTIGYSGLVGINCDPVTYQLNVNGSLYASSLVLGAVLPVDQGGTGAGTFTAGGILLGNTTGVVQVLDAVVVGKVLLSGGEITKPSYGKVGLTTHISGTLAIGNGGTGITTAVKGDIIYAGAANTWNNLNLNTSNKQYFVLQGTGVYLDTLPDWGLITNNNIDSSAAIATSKLSGAVTNITGHGLGDIASQAKNSIDITGGVISGLTSLGSGTGNFTENVTIAASKTVDTVDVSDHLHTNETGMGKIIPTYAIERGRGTCFFDDFFALSDISSATTNNLWYDYKFIPGGGTVIKFTADTACVEGSVFLRNNASLTLDATDNNVLFSQRSLVTLGTDTVRVGCRFRLMNTRIPAPSSNFDGGFTVFGLGNLVISPGEDIADSPNSGIGFVINYQSSSWKMSFLSRKGAGYSSTLDKATIANDTFYVFWMDISSSGVEYFLDGVSQGTYGPTNIPIVNMQFFTRVAQEGINWEVDYMYIRSKAATVRQTGF